MWKKSYLCKRKINTHTPKKMRKTLFIFVMFVLAVAANAQSAATAKHEVQPGETLYSIARKYETSVARIKELNPGLNPDYIMAGQKLNVPAGGSAQGVAVQGATQQQEQAVTQVSAQPTTQATPQSDILNRPQYKAKHEVKKKETIYSISRQYGITENKLIEANPQLKNGKLKKGAVINIPYTDAEDAQYQQALKAKQDADERAKVKKYDAINVAVILPFASYSETMSTEAQKMANLYQGFLLAVDSLKQRGYSVNVYAYDETSHMSTLLQKDEMKSMQLIIGPMRQYNLNTVAKFAHENGIAHVVPMANDLSIVNEHPTTFQINTHSSIIYSLVYNRFISMHRQDNIIFVNTNDRGDNMSYINGFKAALDAQGVKYHQADVNEISALKDMLSSSLGNVIIPYSGSSSAFDNLCKRLNSLEIPDNCSVQLFGFPEWQTFSSKHEANMNKYQCQFFTSFYSNSASSRTRQFNALFQRWFRQSQYNSFPRYGELGYDIGAYFIKGLRDYGSAFYDNLHNYSYSSLEFPFSFEKKNSWSGYQNKSVLIVTRKPDGTVQVR